MTPLAPALRVLTGHTATPEQRAAAQAVVDAHEASTARYDDAAAWGAMGSAIPQETMR